MDSIKRFQMDYSELQIYPEKKEEIIKRRFNDTFEYYKKGFFHCLFSLFGFSYKQARIYGLLLALFFFLTQLVIFSHNYYIESRDKIINLNAENESLKKDINAIGGLGVSFEEINDFDSKEIIDLYLGKHGIDKYDWKYPEIEKPVEVAFVTSEKGDSRPEGEHTGTDFKTINTLKTTAGIDGFCKVGYDKYKGYNVTITNFVVMTNAVGNKEIKKVEIIYEHLSKILVKDRQWIKKKEIIGYIGNSGKCMIYDTKIKKWRDITSNERKAGYGSHLHFEVKINGVSKNIFWNSTFYKVPKL